MADWRLRRLGRRGLVGWILGFLLVVFVALVLFYGWGHGWFGGVSP